MKLDPDTTIGLICTAGLVILALISLGAFQ